MSDSARTRQARFMGGVAAEELPLPDASFEVVTSQYGLEYADLHRALEGLGATVGRFDAYLAAGTRVHVDCRDTGDSAACDDFGIESVTVVREDGLAIELADEVRHPAETS